MARDEEDGTAAEEQTNKSDCYASESVGVTVVLVPLFSPLVDTIVWLLTEQFLFVDLRFEIRINLSFFNPWLLYGQHFMVTRLFRHDVSATTVQRS